MVVAIEERVEPDKRTLPKLREPYPKLEADRPWFREALEALYDICNTRERFTADDVWERLERRGIPIPLGLSLMSSVLRVGVKNRWCLKSSFKQKSRRRLARGRRVSMYHSVGGRLPDFPW